MRKEDAKEGVRVEAAQQLGDVPQGAAGVIVKVWLDGWVEVDFGGGNIIGAGDMHNRVNLIRPAAETGGLS